MVGGETRKVIAGMRATGSHGATCPTAEPHERCNAGEIPLGKGEDVPAPTRGAGRAGAQGGMRAVAQERRGASTKAAPRWGGAIGRRPDGRGAHDETSSCRYSSQDGNPTDASGGRRR